MVHRLIIQLAIDPIQTIAQNMKRNEVHRGWEAAGKNYTEGCAKKWMESAKVCEVVSKNDKLSY